MLRKPLKLKWGKKSGRYELSLDIFVLTVYVGETPLIQCTLTTQSTARDCLEHLCEKIDLNQAEFFGFRFQMRVADPDRRQMRWVEMDRPLRKQLEKWASKPRQLQLAILYHTPNVFSLHDQMARSLYFMLLKLEVLSGRFVMDAEKYVNLAAYCLQVENSDYDPHVHTVEQLTVMKLLPEHLCRNVQLYEDLLSRILTVYEGLAGMQSSQAAFLYIVDVQQCDGYGEEFFSAKDDESTEVKLGYSLEEIFVRRYNGSTLKYKWTNVKSITSAKRNLTIKCQDGVSAIFTLEDADMAKYVVTVLTWQWTYATTDAIRQKFEPMSVENLQSEFPKIGHQCGHLRQSNADLYSTRTTNSVDMSAIPAPLSLQTPLSTTAANIGAARKMAPLSVEVSRLSSMPETSRLTASNAFNATNANIGTSAADALIQQSTVHSIQSVNHPPISANNNAKLFAMNPSGNHAYLAPSNSTPSLSVNKLFQPNYEVNCNSANNSPVYRPAGMNNFKRPVAFSLQQQQITPISRENVSVAAAGGESGREKADENEEEEWLQMEQREVLKKLLAQQQKIKAIGSSPEIHMLEAGQVAARTRPLRQKSNSNLMRRAFNPHFRPATPTSNRLSDEKTTADYLAVVDDDDSGCGDTDSQQQQQTPYGYDNSFCPKWCSTPNLMINNNTNNNANNNNSSKNAPPSANNYCYQAPNGGRKYIKQRNELNADNRWAAGANVRNDLLAGANLHRPAVYFSVRPPASPPSPNDDERTEDTNPTGEASLLAKVGHSSSAAFSQGKIVASSADGHRAIGQPIIYPIPTASTHSTNANGCAFLPPTYPTEYIQNNCYTHRNSLTVSNTSSISSSDGNSSTHPPQQTFFYGEPTTTSFADNNNPTATYGNMPKESLSATASEASVASSPHVNPALIQLLIEQNKDKTIAMAMEQQMHRQQLHTTTTADELNAAAGSLDAVSNGVQCTSGSVYRTSLTNATSNGSYGMSNELASALNVRPQQKQQVLLQQQQQRRSSNGASKNNTVAAAVKTKSANSETNLKSVLLAKLAIPQAVETEFAGIPAKRLSAGYSTSQCPDNQARNRVGKVFPYEDTRVILRSHKRNVDGYMNASHVNMCVGEHCKLSYIVAQAPMRNTVDDFWSMVWESDARLIVMLVNPHQMQKATACPAYWPMKTGEKLQFGQAASSGGQGAFWVKLISSSSLKCQTTSVLALKSLSKGGPKRIVYHLYCADFSEEGVPSSTDTFLGFIDAVNSVRKHIENEEREMNSLLSKQQKKCFKKNGCDHNNNNSINNNDNANRSSEREKKQRSRSIGRINFFDVTNRLRMHSVDGGNLLRKKFSATSSSNSSSVSQTKFSNSTTDSATTYQPTTTSNGVDSNSIIAKDPVRTPLTIVHCTDGASESGVFVLVEVILRCIENNTEMEVAHLLRCLRQQRMCLVKNPSQYRFVYELVVAYLQCSRLI